jgi:putative membrane-bound dehydrogenase-like protein
MRRFTNIFSLVIFLCTTSLAVSQQIPRGQSKPPGPPLSPADAIKKMTVPEGFSVELVAAEPDLVNPVAMTIDERGRFWVCESVEYPRSSPGKGADRIKIMEDTDGDGTCDKFTLFADGLNIPSGIAVGHGGVWVANSPDILFLQDTDGDGKADKQEVVVTGFGRTDTHELPNSLTWGPDGWLYGLNGVFNHSHVRYSKTNPNFKEGQPGWKFTVAMFRIHPVTREFQVFAEGTSNPWGIAFDKNGSAFLSACVIDHLWHITESGYYHRQAGAYPPFTWKIESIVDHKHQQAAYCGIHYFDSDAYPLAYREKLYMGNIHGGCLNADEIHRDGSTYHGKPLPDFLSANDAWFMTVAQKTGPDGCLYVLDWYDRYHCYQDARRDPKGIDRLKGRLYRVRYKDTPRVKDFDLGKQSDAELVALLSAENDFIRSTAQRLLIERKVAVDKDSAAAKQLVDLVLNNKVKLKFRLQGLWAIGSVGPFDVELHDVLLHHQEPALRAWAVRFAGNQGELDERLKGRVVALASDDSAHVRLQVAIAARKLEAVDAMSVLLEVLSHSGKDPLIPRIVWQNLHPLLESGTDHFLELVSAQSLQQSPALADLMPRIVDRVLASEQAGTVEIAGLVALLLNANTEGDALKRSLAVLSQQIQTGQIKADERAQLAAALAKPLAAMLEAGGGDDTAVDVAVLAASWGDNSAVNVVHDVLVSADQPELRRLAALEALTANKDERTMAAVHSILSQPKRSSQQFRASVIAALGQLEDLAVAKKLIELYPTLDDQLQPRVIELLTSRGSWSESLVTAVADEKISRNAVNVNQIRKLFATASSEQIQQLEKVFGKLRTERNEDRARVIEEISTMLAKTKGDPHKGIATFSKMCGQCHKIYGSGADVGPDITRNGRGDYRQLLSNMFDPSLVIGASYQARTVLTVDGRVLTGLIAEETPQRVVLKVQGGKQEIIAADDIEQMKVSKLSMMPEDLEKQLKPQELADLMAFLTLDKHPDDPTAKFISGTPRMDLASYALPETAKNLLATAKLESNTSKFGNGRRGKEADVIYLPSKQAFLAESQWHEDGVPMQKDLGVVSEESPVYWQATWDKPVEINTITLSGCYPNQPQEKTAWKIEVHREGDWQTLERGLGGWVSDRRYLWGGESADVISIEGFRVSMFSPDLSTPVKSLHFRGEEGFSWFVGKLVE